MQEANRDKPKIAPDEIPGQDEESRICFVISSYGGLHDLYYKEIYKPAIVAAGLLPRRASEFYTHKTLLESMWIHVQRAVVVLADLGGGSPNVFYELGMAHAIAKPTVVVTPTEEDIPTDLKALPLITYDVHYPKWDSILIDRITAEIERVRKEPGKYVLLGPSASASALSPDEELISVENASPQKLVGIIREYVRKGRSKQEVLDVLSRAGLGKHDVFIATEYDRIRPRN